jgi:hypothetical protein
VYSPHWYLKENMPSYFNMATAQEKRMCIFPFFKTKSVIKKQLRYRTQYLKDPPSDNAIRSWVKEFQETGNVLHPKGAERTSTWQEVLDRIQEAWTSHMPGKACMLKLFCILQYWFYKWENMLSCILIFLQQFYGIFFVLRIIDHGNPDNNLESFCSTRNPNLAFVNVS